MTELWRACALMAVLAVSGCNTLDGVEEREVTAATDYPTAKRVPDNPHLVFSPFTTEAHYVEVQGLRSGTLVKCPWTEKLFYVP